MKTHRNRGLFSNYYLDELLPKEEEFNVSISEVKDVLEKIKGIWDKSRFETINEDQLRKHFLDKVLDCLGWVVDVNAPVPSGEWSKRPDYALFKDSESLKVAHKWKKEDYFKKTACIAEAKRWGRPLDKKLKTETDLFEAQNPALQISRYLWLTGVKWGILTDGKHWRLYERETSKRLDIFYEVDLEDLIESGSPEDFRYFYLLFRKDAFPEFIEKVYKGSVDYAQAVGEKLKENVYQALKTLAQGFLKTPGNNLSEANLKEIHDNSLIFLYRLLFILYAEYRDLLPLGSNKLYTESYSLDAFKKEVANRLDKNEPIATSTFGYWNRLKELFEIINKGNKELDVPPYNGGLFEPEKHSFLEKHRAGDLYIAKAVDLLSRSRDKAYIDYGSLEIRHLGSIYEGLLEYKLKIADQDLVPIKDKSKELFVSLEEAKKQKKKIREDEIVRTGEVYLVTDKDERKATGSYYTPDYIVKYIIDNTLSPIIEEKKKTALQIADNKVKDINNIKNEIKNLKIQKSKAMNPVMVTTIEQKVKEKENQLNQFEQESKPTNIFLEEILNIKVLDPAMGSGHFLVEATDFLARELLKVLSGEPLEGGSREMMIGEETASYGLKDQEEEDIRWARREVVERCIFGVDLNPMAVELAKLSLWLYTVAKNRPLNFLDHHFRCGNSLIGARIDDLAGLPELKKKKKTVEGQPVQLGLFESVFKEKVNILLGAFAQIEMLPSDTVEQIREKERLYQDFRKIVSRFQDVADVWTSRYFGSEIDFSNYQSLQDKLRSHDEEWITLSQEPWFQKAKEIANEKCFFHWELEFPEVFFEGHLRKENPGFDAVVGNPPYGISFDTIEKEYLEKKFLSFIRNNDFYAAFSELTLVLSKVDGIGSLIIPNTFILGPYFNNLKRCFLNYSHMREIVDFGFIMLFEDPNVYSAIFFSERQNRIEIQKQTMLTKASIDNGQINVISRKEVQLKDLPLEAWKIYHPIVHKAQINSIKLGDLAYVKDIGFNYWTIGRGKKRGESIGSRILYEGQQKNAKDIPFLKGSDFDVYDIPIPNNHWLRFNFSKLLDPEVDIFRFSPEFLQIDCKIVYRQTSDKLIATIDRGSFLVDKTVHIVLFKEKAEPFKYEFVLSFLNSKLANLIYTQLSVEEGRAFAQVKTFRVKELPIYNIYFVTPRQKREQRMKEAKTCYLEYLNSGNPDTLLYFVESRLMKEHEPDPELVKKHNADPLNKDFQITEGALWEQSDVVHDILAFLAEQMIEMNKEKQKEIRGFIEWLESQLKIQSDTKGNTGIEALTGKTQIKNYIGDYQKGEQHLSFEDFWKILEKNKAKIQASLNSRELYENIKSEYEKSLSKLLPLKQRLQKTDWLIDQTVYKLYGLTDEEMQMVENSLGK